MDAKKKICVYCSSSNHLERKYYDFAQELGVKIGQNGFDMVYGGTMTGMMGVTASNAQKNGASVLSVIPESIVSLGLESFEQSEIIITKDMRERKAVMEKNSDIFFAAPGGFGTFEEIFEIITAKQLGYHNKPVIFLNFDGYYNNLIKMFDTVYENKFAKEETKNIYHIAENTDDAFNYVKNYTPSEYVIKW